MQDQLYLFAEQVHRLKTLERYGVEYAVCDSPLPLNIIYNNTPDELFDQLVMHEHTKFDNVEYLLRRNDEFISIDGRKEINLERAKVKDEETGYLINESSFIRRAIRTEMDRVFDSNDEAFSDSVRKYLDKPLKSSPARITY